MVQDERQECDMASRLVWVHRAKTQQRHRRTETSGTGYVQGGTRFRMRLYSCVHPAGTSGHLPPGSERGCTRVCTQLKPAATWHHVQNEVYSCVHPAGTSGYPDPGSEQGCTRVCTQPTPAVTWHQVQNEAVLVCAPNWNQRPLDTRFRKRLYSCVHPAGTSGYPEPGSEQGCIFVCTQSVTAALQ